METSLALWLAWKLVALCKKTLLWCEVLNKSDRACEHHCNFLFVRTDSSFFLKNLIICNDILFKLTHYNRLKRCSCPFGTIIWDVNLGRCHENLGWKFIIIYFFNWQTEKKPVLDQSEVCLPKYHNKFLWHRPKLTSQIIVPNGHEHLSK